MYVALLNHENTICAGLVVRRTKTKLKVIKTSPYKEAPFSLSFSTPSVDPSRKLKCLKGLLNFTVSGSGTFNLSGLGLPSTVHRVGSWMQSFRPVDLQLTTLYGNHL